MDTKQATSDLDFTTTTYSDTGVDACPAVHVSWEGVTRVLGRPHRGTAADDALLVMALLASGAPAWVSGATGWTDEHGWGLYGDAPELTTYLCTDGNADVEIEAPSPEDAALEYVNEGDWGDELTTRWVLVYVSDPDDETERVRVEIEPAVPPCAEGRESRGHRWVEGDPRGHGGGVVIPSWCPHCGCGRTLDTWAQDRATGEQGLESVTYLPGAHEPIDVPEGWAIYHREDAGQPDMHDCSGGDWYYEPEGWDVGEVYSHGYRTPEQAVAACLDWEEQVEAAESDEATA